MLLLCAGKGCDEGCDGGPSADQQWEDSAELGSSEHATLSSGQFLRHAHRLSCNENKLSALFTLFSENNLSRLTPVNVFCSWCRRVSQVSIMCVYVNLFSFLSAACLYLLQITLQKYPKYAHCCPNVCFKFASHSMDAWLMRLFYLEASNGLNNEPSSLPLCCQLPHYVFLYSYGFGLV